VASAREHDSQAMNNSTGVLMKALNRTWIFASFALCLIASLVRLAVAADLDQPIPFDIPANTPLGDALIQWSNTAHLQVMFATHNLDGKVSAGAQGSLTPRTALAALLQHSGLVFSLEGDHTITVTPQSLFERTAMALTGEDRTPGADDPARAPAVGESSTPSPMDASDNNAPSGSEQPRSKLEEVVVTGTHIVGGAPVGSQLLTVTDVDIQNSGYSTIGDVIRSLPQAFGGGINPGVLGTSQVNSAQNVDSASTVNLRGLGSDSTLTLIDGHRLAANGFTSAADISSIPLSALERVEILADSASAIYGSDAVAGVANFILKKNYEGAETNATIGEANGGAAKDWLVSQLLGTSWSGGNIMLSYEHFSQQALYASDRSFSSDALAPLSLLPEQKRDSVLAAVHEDFTDSLSAYSEALYSHRDANVVESLSDFAGPYSTYNGSSTTQYAISTGVAARVAADWSVGLDGTAARDKVNGSSFFIPEISSSSTAIYGNRSDSIEFHGAGPVLTLPSGPVEAAAGGGHRTEAYNDNSGTNLVTRNVNYGYAEIRVPLLGDDAARSGLEKLHLSVAGRYEDYSDFGRKTTPKLGLLYQPIKDLSLRASWGKAFRAPNLSQEYGGFDVGVYPGSILGVTSPPGAQAIYISGANPALQPETARSWSSGFDYQPAWQPHLKLNATYFHIDYDDRITQPVNSPRGAIANPIYAAFVTPNPSAAAQAVLISQAAFFNDFTGSYDPTKVAAILSNEYQNAVSQTIHGIDVTGDYGWQGAAGNFDLSFNTAWLGITEVLTPGSPEMALTGTVFNPPRFRARLGLTWRRGPWSAASFVNYVSGETDNTQVISVPVASWTTVDAQAAFDASGLGPLFRGTRISFAGQNLLNRNPPQLMGASTSLVALGYDSTNASPLGRFLSITVRKDW
jgi:iron complex outermembrane recepter protein